MYWSSLAAIASRLNRRRYARFASLLFLALSVFITRDARADTFTLHKTEEGYPLGMYLGILQDPTEKLTIHDVAKPERKEEFREAGEPAPGFGFSSAAFWVRFTVRNPEPTPKEWLLELAYPHLDSVELYVPTEDGKFKVRRTGDHLPFAKRDVEHRNFVFRLSEPPSEQGRVYYMRVHTTGSVNLPLLAWTPEAFQSHQNREQPILWMFYGLILVLGLYNLFIYASVREPDYLHYVLYIFSYALFQFTLNGLTFQYLLPNQSWLVNQILPPIMAVAFLWSMHFQRHYLRMAETMPRTDRALNVSAWALGVFSAVALFAPYKWGIRIVVVLNIVLTVWLMGNAVYLAVKGQRAAKLYLAGWSMLRIGIFLYSMKTMGALPDNLLTNWSIQIGSAVEALFFSLALADRINMMRANLATLNAQLTQNVSDLRVALAKAEAATVAKSNFLATVSHELRTPLNAIINIPQALLLDLPVVERAVCGACNSVFELDEGDEVTGETPCPECQQRGSLRLEKKRLLRGSLDEFATNLGHIERSGKHLLQVVDGVLDFSRIEAQRLELKPELVNVRALVAEALEPLKATAAASGVTLDIQPVREDLVIECDPLRVRQVLLNLTGNAIKFSDGRGCVTVTVREEEHGCVFQVRDQGIGIAPEDIHRLFRSFEQVHQGNTRRFGGTGLGLSISRSLVEMHGGEIWVESQLGRGSCFSFRIPYKRPGARPDAVPEKSQDPSATEHDGLAAAAEVSEVQVANDAPIGAPMYDLAEVARQSKGSEAMRKVDEDSGRSRPSAAFAPVRAATKERILYVEDDDDNFRVAQLRLRDRYELVRATGAAQACRMLAQDTNWSTILMDIELCGSELDGVELTKLLRGRLRGQPVPSFARNLGPVDVPVIFVTAHGAKYSEATLLLAGAEKVISKPVDFGALNIALTQLHLGRARQKARG
jgi:signal transduction histidine kinase/FixJ family two-component response regulator